MMALALVIAVYNALWVSPICKFNFHCVDLSIKILYTATNPSDPKCLTEWYAVLLVFQMVRIIVKIHVSVGRFSVQGGAYIALFILDNCGI